MDREIITKRVAALCAVMLFGFSAFGAMAAAPDDAFDAEMESYAAEAEAKGGNDAEDPIEPVNRLSHQLNEKLDMFLFKPAAKAYVWVFPNFARTGIRNFLNNLNSPIVLANSFFQGDMQNSWVTIERFAVNTTLGVGGLYDFANEQMNMPLRTEDFGQTMGYYDIASGPYIVWPILGPSNLRDSVGDAVDYVINPLTYFLRGEEEFALKAVDGLDLRARNLELVDNIYQTSLDPYVTIRSLYTQRREAEIKNEVETKIEAKTAAAPAPLMPAMAAEAPITPPVYQVERRRFIQESNYSLRRKALMKGREKATTHRIRQERQHAAR